MMLSRSIDWELIRRQYDEMVKHATALRLGTAEAEAILRRFTRENTQHPTYSSPLIKSAAVLSATKYCPQSSYMTQYFVLPETRRHFVNGLTRRSRSLGRR